MSQQTPADTLGLLIDSPDLELLQRVADGIAALPTDPAHPSADQYQRLRAEFDAFVRELWAAVPEEVPRAS